MNLRKNPLKDIPRHRLKAGLGISAGVLLLLSLFLPYWQAHLFAPQYRNGLKATMYAYKVGGDVQEIDGLNHYVGVSKLGNLAKLEKKVAIPAVILLSIFCFFIPRLKDQLYKWLMASGVISFPFLFMANLSYWLHYASTNLDPTAPLKLKPFSIPLYGIGKVGQFRSEVGPMLGFYIILVAVALILVVLLLPDKPNDARNSGSKPT